jgi:uncharacterized membrane protein
MTRNFSIGLVAAGIIIVALGVVLHYALTIEIFPHFNVVIGVIGLIVAAIGAWRLWSDRQRA